jgi:hypothetical protein
VGNSDESADYALRIFQIRHYSDFKSFSTF